jgi:D-aminopeptidase
VQSSDIQVYDFIVVGAGSAGAAVAHRLSENPRHLVLLLEAGRASHPWSRIPLSSAKLINNPSANWLYTSEPDANTNGRRIPVPRGRLLGGSSAINGNAFVRGQRQDFDTWAQLGNRGWSYQDVLPFFKRMENYEGGDETLRGRGGPLRVTLPRQGRIWKEPAFAGFHSYNGCGEMTGTHWIEESGMLSTPICITNTAQVGTVHTAMGAYAVEHGYADDFELPVVAETYDGWLNDMPALHVRDEHVFAAFDTAGPGPVAEGCAGGGTGMICHEFKGGIGTSSRVVETAGEAYTVGVLVQTNYGAREDLRLDGVPVGIEIPLEKIPSGWDEAPGSGSIIIVIATDAPLLAFQCKRLAQRAATGLSRVGGYGHNGSGDIFLAFATGNRIDETGGGPVDVRMLPNARMNGLFHAAADAVEESIWNALLAAETTTGLKGRTAYAVPHEEVVVIWSRYRGK